MTSPKRKAVMKLTLMTVGTLLFPATVLTFTFYV